MPKVVTVTHIRNYNVLADSSALWQMFYCVRLPYGHVSNSTESQAIDLSSRMVDSSKTNPEDSSLQLPSSAPKRTPGDSVCSGLRCSKHFKTMFPMFCSCTRDTLSTPKKKQKPQNPPGLHRSNFPRWNRNPCHQTTPERRR